MSILDIIEELADELLIDTSDLYLTDKGLGEEEN